MPKSNPLNEYNNLIPRLLIETTNPDAFNYQTVDHTLKMVLYSATLSGINLNHNLTINPKGNFKPCKELLLKGYKAKGI